MEEVLTVCDGIGAVHEAWKPLGWTFVLTSEIEAFPREVLAVRQAAVEFNGWLRRHDRDATVPLWPDFTALRVRHLLKYGVRIPSVLAGGTPCQAFSIAGLRKSLDDARGNLTLAFVRLANAIDALRRRLGLKPLVIVWENVPGVLSVKDNAFGCFLAALVGADAPLVPPGKRGKPGRWTNAGLVVGPQRAAAWRELDAQYFELAQRRRRVFVIASAREGFDPAAVLFEPEGVRRDSPPRRETGQGAAASLTASAGGVSGKDGADGRVVGTLTGGGRSEAGYSYDDIPLTPEVAPTIDAAFGRLQGCSGQDLNHGHGHLVAYGGNNTSGPIDVTPALLAQPGAGWKGDFESETFIAYPITADALRGEGSAKTPSADAEGRVRLRDPGLGIGGPEDPAATLSAAGPGAVVAFQTRGSNLDVSDGDGVTGTLGSNADRASGSAPCIAYNLSPGSGSDGAPSAVESEVAAALTGEAEANKNGRGTHVIAFGSKDSGLDAAVELSPTLRAGGFAGSHANAGVPPAVAFIGEPIPFDTTQITHPENRSNPQPGDPAGTLAKGGHPPAIAFALRGREEGALPEVHEAGDTTGTLRAADGGSSRDYVAGFTVSQNADGFAWEGEVSATLQARSETPSANQFNGVRVESSVRRLTPTECERLQGYRDGYTAIPWRGGTAPDGPRYKALGNSMAVPVMAWIGRRIEAEERHRLAAGFQ